MVQVNRNDIQKADDLNQPVLKRKIYKEELVQIVLIYLKNEEKILKNKKNPKNLQLGHLFEPENKKWLKFPLTK